MPKKKPRLQFRYYEMCANEQVLALLGESWRRPYGEGISDLHFHNYLEVGICYEGHGKSILQQKTVTIRMREPILVKQVHMLYTRQESIM